MHRIEERSPPEAIYYVAGLGGGAGFFLLLSWLVSSLLLFLVAIVFGTLAWALHKYFESQRESVVVESQRTDVTDFVDEAFDELPALDKRVRAHPDEVGKRCRRITTYFENLDRPPRRGDVAHVWATSILASVERLKGRSKSADHLLEQVQESEVPERDRRAFLLHHYLNTEEVSANAVAFLVKSLEHADEFRGRTLERVRERLRATCRVDSAMSHAELRDRIAWSRAAARALPTAAWPLIEEATAFFHLGRHDRAEAILAAVPKDEESWRAIALQARIDHLHGRVDRATRRLRSLLGTEGTNVTFEVALEVAEQLYDLGAEEDAEAALDPYGDDPQAASRVLLLKAGWRLAEGQEKAARELLEVALVRDPHNARAGTLLAEICRRLGDHERAHEILADVAKDNPDDAGVQFALAASMWNADKPREAAEAFERCAFLKVGSSVITYYWARSLLRIGRYAEAGRLFDEGRINDERIAADAAFHQGIAWMHAADGALGDEAVAALDRAWPSFVRANKLYRERGDRPASLRAKRNLLVCYQSLAEALVARGEFLRAAKTYEVVSRNVPKDSKHLKGARRNASEAYVRAGLASLAKRKDADAEKRLADGLRLHGTWPRHMLRAGVLLRLNRDEEALAIYERCLAEKPREASVGFARSLALSRLGRDEGALRAIVAEGGKYFLRAALGVADREAEAGRFAAASAVLVEALERPGARENHFHGEASSKAALYAVKAKQVDVATRIVHEHLGADESSKAKILLGALLVEVGEYAEALPYLEAAVADGEKRKEVLDLYETVVRRVAVDLCGKDDFKGARAVLMPAVERTGQGAKTYGLSDRSSDNGSGQGELGQYLQLVEAVAEGGSGGGLNEATFSLLKQLHEEARRPEPIVVRPLIVGMWRRATEIAGTDFDNARTMWREAREIWKGSAAKSKSFWEAFVATYNVGKDYQLEAEGRELRDRIEAMLATYCVRLVGACLLGEVRTTMLGTGNELGTVKFFWDEAVEFVGQERSRKLLDEHVNFQEVGQRIQREDSAGGMELLEFLCNVHPKPELEMQLANVAIGAAKQALVDGDVVKFKRYIRYVGKAGDDGRTLVNLFDQLSTSLLSAVLRCFNRRDLAQLSVQNPQVYREVVFGVVVQYAHAKAQFPQLDASSVPTVFPQLVDAVVNSLTNQ